MSVSMLIWTNTLKLPSQSDKIQDLIRAARQTTTLQETCLPMYSMEKELTQSEYV